MAYTRRKGNQVVIVHGERDPETRKVQQRTLFTFYSKDELKAALGEHQHWFRTMLQESHPWIRFNWGQIDKGLEEAVHGEEVPDIYPYRHERVDKGFRQALVGLVRELLVTDPQRLASSALLLRKHRHDLEYLRELIDRRLRLATQENAEESEWTRDTVFFWRRLMNRREVPPECFEEVYSLVNQGKLDKAEALAQLLLEAWDNFADGHIVLGLVAVEREDLELAKSHFQNAVEVARRLFPKRIAKSSYWRDISTRPYIRALCQLGQVLNRLEDYDEALAICDQLEKQCGQDIQAALERIPVHINRGAFRDAADAALFVCEIHPEQHLPLSLAQHELGEHHEARSHLLAAALHTPRAVRMLANLRPGRRPETMNEVRDHNSGVELSRDLAPYLKQRLRSARRFIKSVVKDDRVTALMKEAADVRRRRSEDRTGDRTSFDRMKELESLSFARNKAAEYWPK